MSVREYSFEEIEQLYADIQGVKSGMPICTVEAEELQDALRAAYYANRAALGCSYNEDMKLLRCEVPKGFNPKAKFKEVFKNIGMLLYNCVTNGGRDFMPQSDRNVLERMQREIAWYVIEQIKEVDVMRKTRKSNKESGAKSTEKLFNVYCICKVPGVAVVKASNKKEAFRKAKDGDYIEFDAAPFSSSEKKSFYDAEEVDEDV